MEFKMVLKRNDLSWIVVADLNKSLEYFTKVLGLKVVEHNSEFGWAELVTAEPGGAILGIAQANDHDDESYPGQNAVMTFSVDSLDQTKTELTKKGAKFVGEVLEIPGDVKMQTFIDLDGNSFQIVEQIKKRS
jgi:predicted enzyme related to lactoylglutathione lyase